MIFRSLIRRVLDKDKIRSLDAELSIAQAHISILIQDFAVLAAVPSGDAEIDTEHPVAVTSDDHIHPKGTAFDNTRHPRFVSALRQFLGNDISFLDLGCSGGGIVFDFLLAGHDAYGIEGSDFSRKHKRAMWNVIPDRLFTADISKSFHLHSDQKTKLFRVISAWEVLEHLHEDDLETFFANVKKHLRPDGVFVASIATEDDIEGDINWHKTVQPKSWWLSRCSEYGFEPVDLNFSIADYPRGSGNPTALDWNFEKNPEKGFHLAIKPSA